MTTGVFYLWRRGNPHEMARRFFASLAAHPAGEDFDLILMRKGFAAHEPLPPTPPLTTSGALRAESWSVDDALHPIDVFFHAAGCFDYDRVLFLVSQSRVRVPNWLAHLSKALDAPDVGLVGATGSYEGIPGAPFPNPSIRTTGFLIDRARFLSLARESGRRGGLAFEGGPDSMTRQIERRGLRALVVDARGAAWEPDAWPESRTFRSGDQENLLIADNRTRHFAMAGPAQRRKLARLAFGDRAQPTRASLIRRARARLWMPT